MWNRLNLSTTLHCPSFRRIVLLIGAIFTAINSPAQNTPLISGGVGFFTNTSGGNTSYIPTIEPLIAAPLGSKALVESRATLLEDFYPSGEAIRTFTMSHSATFN